MSDAPPTVQQRSTRPKDQDLPGWNDPPPLQFSSQATNVKPKLNLSKRVAFPLANCTGSKPTAIIPPQQISTNTNLPTANLLPTSAHQAANIATAPIAIVPPMPHHRNQQPPQNQLPPPALPPSSAQQILRVPPMISPAEETQNENLQEYCINIFQQHISQDPETNSNLIRTDEIQRRINLIQETWNTFNAPMHRKLFNIAKALELKNFNEAIENHRQLVIEHFTSCTQWASALRQIILTLQGNNADNDNPPIESAVPLINHNIFVPSTTNDSSTGSGVQHI